LTVKIDRDLGNNVACLTVDERSSNTGIGTFYEEMEATSCGKSIHDGLNDN
jgi:hypothetical protein